MKIETIGDATLYLGDCREILPMLGKVDAVVTDPPYPDWLAVEYGYREDGINFLKEIPCRQIVFWSTKIEFPLDYSARHVWDKKTGCGSEYEFAFERNGQRNFKVFRHYLINSDVAASFTGDVWTGHKSQKPLALMLDIIDQIKTITILDPFMGSGTTGVACANLGRKFIGIEIEPKYFDIACRRIEAAYKQPRLFKDEAPKPVQEAMEF